VNQPPRPRLMWLEALKLYLALLFRSKQLPKTKTRRPIRWWEWTLGVVVMGVGLGVFAHGIWEDRDNLDQVPRAASVGDRTPELVGFTLESEYGRNTGEERKPAHRGDSFSDSSEAEWTQQIHQGDTVTVTYHRHTMSPGRSGVTRARRDFEDDKPRETSRYTNAPELGHEAYEVIDPSWSSAYIVVRMHNVVIHVRYSWLGTGAYKEEAALRVVRGIAAAAIEPFRP
jgi:hypothetical protein